VANRSGLDSRSVERLASVQNGTDTTPHAWAIRRVVVLAK